MSDTTLVRFELDGETAEVQEDPLTPVTRVISEVLDRPGVVEPCGVGACGGCTLLVDGETRLGCLTPIGLLEGRSVVTIAAIAEDDPVVVAYEEANAFQCGYCTPGFVLATMAMRATGADPGRESVIEGLAGNLCRCSSYVAIIDAARASLER